MFTVYIRMLEMLPDISKIDIVHKSMLRQTWSFDLYPEIQANKELISTVCTMCTLVPSVECCWQ